MRVSRNKRRLEANQKPLVTVIIPAYNSQKYIRRADLVKQKLYFFNLLAVNQNFIALSECAFRCV